MTQKKGGANQPVMESYNRLVGNRITNVTTSAQRLVNAVGVEAFTTIVQASHDNTQTVLVGSQNVQPFELESGEAVSIPTSPELIYVRAVAGTQVINWLAGA